MLVGTGMLAPPSYELKQARARSAEPDRARAGGEEEGLTRRGRWLA
jgi:hypothetical protein